MYVKKGRKVVPLLGMLASQLARGVDVRLIHAKEFWPAFREDCEKYPYRQPAYIGAANLTGAALGMKSVQRRNFEAGIPTTEAELVGHGIRHFDAVLMGSPALRAAACKIAATRKAILP